MCQQLSWQNLSFYFVLNLDIGPYSVLGSSYILLKIANEEVAQES